MYFFCNVEHNFFMVILVQFFSFCFFLLNFSVAFKLKKEIGFKSISVKNLIEYLPSKQNKKRKIINGSCEISKQNGIFLKHFQKRNNKLKYKKLKTSYLSFCLKSKNKQKPTYVEMNNQRITNHIYSLTKQIDNKINSEKRTFRSIGGECLIETIASSFANAVLIENDFNMFSNFKELCMFSKVYKKEAEILNILIISKLIEIYLILQKQIYDVKKKVFQGKKLKHIKKNTPAETIYGTYLLNKSASKIFIESNQDIVKATNIVLENLDEIEQKQKLIFRHIKLLEKTL